MTVIEFPKTKETRELQDARLTILHEVLPTLDQLAASQGTPEEWLSTAILHLKAAQCEQGGGAVRVSSAALSLVLFRLEELEQGGKPWGGNVA